MTDFHRFPIGKILEHYEFDPVEDGVGWRPVRCAFHGDKDASGSVNTELGVYNCFVCDMKGSATQIIMKMEGVNYSVAHRRAEEISGYRHDAVRGGRSRSPSVSGGSGNYRSYREIRDAWNRQNPDTGT